MPEPTPEEIRRLREADEERRRLAGVVNTARSLAAMHVSEERPPMSDLADFLLARIAEDEQWARYVLEDKYEDDARAPRTLAECEAKKRLVKYARSWKGELTGRPDLDDGHADAMLRALAQVYKDHPDFNAHDWLI